MIACIAAAQSATATALVIRQSAATERRRTDDGHLSQERTPMDQSSTSPDTLDQIRRNARLIVLAHARGAQTLDTMRRLVADLADHAQAEISAANAIEKLVREVAPPLPCQHPARALRYLGRRDWTGGPDQVHAAECSISSGGCGQLVVLERDGGARADGDGSRFMPSTISG